MKKALAADDLVQWPNESAADWTATSVGGKAANLYRIDRVGLTVAPWFVIMPAALDAARAAADGIGTTGQLPVPEPVRAAYRRHAGPESVSVAVRSSATTEDAATGSSAGIYESVLDVAHEDAFVDAVRRCWASLWSERATTYRRERGYPATSMAVIVQHMVSPQVSGVLFTTSPDAADASTMRVAAVDGAARQVVDGSVTTSEYVIDAATGVLDRSASRPRVDGASLTGAQLQELAHAGRTIEAAFRSPQDIEWAFAGGSLFVIQSRPITAPLAPLQPPVWHASRRGLWTRAGLGEWLQRPLTPIFATLCMPAFEDATEDLFDRHLGLRRREPTWTTSNGFYFARAGPTSMRRMATAVVRLVSDVRTSIGTWESTVVPASRARVPSPADLSDLDVDDIVSRIASARDVAADMWAWILLTGIEGRLVELAARATYRMLGRDNPPFPTLVAGFTNGSVEADEAIWQVAHHPMPTLSVGEQIERWHTAYGHRIFDLDIGVPPLTVDDALEVHDALRSSQLSPLERIEQQATARTDALATLWTRAGPLARAWLRFVLPVAQRHAQVRENRPFELHRAWPHMYAGVSELGRRAVQRDTLTAEDQAFFLTWSELLTAASSEPDDDLALTARRRQLLHAFQATLTPPPFTEPWLLLSRRPRRWTGSRSSGQFYGRPGSPGAANGNARLVTGPEDFSAFQPGEVLVARYTTPAWTPLMLQASAIVTETGNALAHAAIIAREYGIPAVIGVDNAATILRTGQTLRVDGTAGTVTIDDPRRQQNMTMSPPDLRAAAHDAQRILTETSRPLIVRGRATPVLDSGGEHDAIVFVPVIEQMNFVFAPLVKQMRHKFRVVLYTPHMSATRTVTVRDRANEIGATLDSIGVDRAHLLAWSDGGAGAFRFARQQPHRCRSVTLVGLPDRYRLPAVDAALLRAIRRLPIERAVPDWVVAAFIARHLSGPRVQWRLLFDEASKVTNLSGIFKHSLAPLLAEHRADGPLTVPTAVLWGDGDRLVSRADAEALATILGTPLRVILRGEHFPTFLEPDAVADAVYQLVAGSADG